ncbi:hypothetical protein DICVIV_12191 [Dictyocaulus viviparus]|uniref:Uncharacterized protein n=1 Tax=Dictyocaulus viviparus TaxID=29172 RepID=A0A0D8XDV5_DICVI|nr:hypothetical protein DICVIV_12191 [Dictyocaulus viviparus]
MFGYLLISNKNQVILFGGDRQLIDFLRTLIRREVNLTEDCPSTSYGFYTDSPMESLYTFGETAKFREAYENYLAFTNEEVTLLFLPLISIYRSHYARSGDLVTSMASSQIKMLLRYLKGSHILISIGKSEGYQHQFLDFVEMGIEMNVGPLLPLIEFKLTSMRLGNEFLRSLSDKCVVENCRIREFLDIRKSLFLQTELTFTLPLIKTLSLQIHENIGSNSCYLVSEGEVLASYTSDKKSVWKDIVIADINFLFRLISRKSLKHYEIITVWLHSNKTDVPVFTDVLLCHITDSLTLVCLTEPKYCTLMRNIAKLLMELEHLLHSDDMMRDIRNIRKTMESVSQGLFFVASEKTPRRKIVRGFMRSPERTASFFESIWQRTEDLLKATCERKEYLEGFRAFNNPPLGKSKCSTPSSTKSISNSGTESMTAKCETMMDYVRRQVTNLLQELWLECHGFNEKKVAQFREILATTMSTSQKNMLTDINMAQAVENKSAFLKEFMHPISLGLDMIAYSVSIPADFISLCYIPDWISDEFYSLLKSAADKDYVYVVERAEKRYKFFRLNIEHGKEGSGFGTFRYLRRSIRVKIFAEAIFEEEIYDQLAERQLLKLLDYISTEILSTVSVIC